MKRNFAFLAVLIGVFAFLFVATGPCSWAGKPPSTETQCTDGKDNDHDHLTDCADPDCSADPACTGGGTEAVCTDGIDNDNDGLTDCADPDCSADPACQTRSYTVVAWNDLGMHCACPGANLYLLLPPWNTVRAQVIKQGAPPEVITDSSIVVEYHTVENTDASLKSDPYYSAWLDSAPYHFLGYDPLPNGPDGPIVGLAGFGLNGNMESKGADGYWVAEGIPIFPAIDSHGQMTDPLGGSNRDPYLTAEVTVKDAASGTVLATTSTVMPVAFGGCCGCHLTLATEYGYTATPDNAFAVMGLLHERDSGINIADPAVLDPNNDGSPGPVRCSKCHSDPAVGGATPGYPGLPTSQYTFSDVLHRFHVQSSKVLTDYNPDIATDCYACHPGNNVDCYRGHHVNKGKWCTDCHGDLNQRVAEGQLLDPWSQATLPQCSDCHKKTGEGGGNLNGVFGKFLNSRGHKNDRILCQTCHGEPHALAPSTMADDNVQLLNIQGDSRALGKCTVCHTNKTDSWGTPPH